MSLLRYSLILCICFGFTISSYGQDSTCDNFIEDAIETVGNACDGIQRNQACYGNDAIDAVDLNNLSLETFSNVGDMTDVFNLGRIQTMPFDEINNTWGIAILSLVADLPATVPGQAVTFVVYGNTELRNNVESQVESPTEVPIPMLSAVPSGSLNVRGGPGTTFAVLGTVDSNSNLTLLGRNEASDWVQFNYDGNPAWIYVPLVEVDGDIGILPIRDINEELPSEYVPPIQSLQIVTGIGNSSCEKAPKDGVLIQAPTDTKVHFLINSVEIEIGSTALLQMDGDTLGVNVFDGEVTVSNAGVTETAIPGLRIDVVDGQPVVPVPYDPGDVLYAPIDLLPESVIIPPPYGLWVSISDCFNRSDGQREVGSDTPFSFRVGWSYQTEEERQAGLDSPSYEVTINGGDWREWPLQLSESEIGGYLVEQFWVIEEPIPGTSYIATQTLVGTAAIPGEDNTRTCTVTVQ